MILHSIWIESLVLLLAIVTTVADSRAAQEFVGEELVVQDFLVLPRVGRYGRVAIHVDPVQAALARGDWQPPKAGENITAHDGKNLSWTEAKSAEEGWLEDRAMRGGYAFAEIISSRRQVALLEATGHAMVFVNGEPRAGDPYLTGRNVLPILLREGRNELLFHVAAGKLRVKVSPPPHEVFFDLRDLTVPTLVSGETEQVWLGALLVNCREEVLANVQVNVKFTDQGDETITVDSVPPLGVRKVAIPINPGRQEKNSETIRVALSLPNIRNKATLAETSFDLTVVEKQEPQTRTFRSAIDGSVQSYRLLPASTGDGASPAGMLVTLHDTGESASEHLAEFSSVPGVHLLAPSGRRTEGCDWEDWSASDALEALDNAAKHVAFDSRRVWLRGTGAGGHGVLRLGGIAADRWAALVPRSPWLEYPGEPVTLADTPIEEMLERVAGSSQLTPLLRNTTSCGMLLEDLGTREDPANADVRTLLEVLTAFHPNFEFRSLAEGSPESKLGELLRFCEKQTSPDKATVDEVDCVTYDPARNATSQWLTILGQIEQGSLSRAAMKFDPEENVFLGLTVNVAAISLDVSHLKTDTVVEIAIDGDAVGEFAVDGRPLTFVRHAEGWHPIPTLPRSFKRPERNGGVRSAFENRAILVYGTQGSAEENAWALAKARYDAETILARLNGSMDVVPDTAFDADADRNRNVVLYGNADMNSAWPSLLSTSPVQVRGDGVWIDRRPEMGDDLACVFVRPRRRSANAVVGVVGGTGIVGMRATDRLPFFVSGVSFPDLLLFSSESLVKGNDEVRAAGYFGIGWGVDPGEIVWRDAAL